MYTLYYTPGTCSMAVHVALNEIGADKELKQVDLRANPQDPEFLKLSPRGQVPVLAEDGKPMVEGAAMLVYLLDTYNSPLLPKQGWERAQALQWLMFANATLHPAYARVFFIKRQNIDDQTKSQLFDAAIAALDKLWAEVDAQLATQPYVCGNECSIADILLAVIANWGQWMPKPVTLGDNVKRMLQAVIARPSYQQALKAEQVEYKAVA